MEDRASQIKPTSFGDALSERYLAYALSTITARSLPDVRDGLKPVHRRLLYAMRELKLDPKQTFKKCARIVGDVMGKYHPHGDQAIYDAMVRLAQDFSVRYPLVDGQGNFGNLDGDRAAAMRYTEARMTPVASLLLQSIDDETVDFHVTYDGEGQEPDVLPANFPNLLANGSTGIAVGMATSIPPHNVDELCKALRHLIKNPDSSIEELMTFINGPDFPTGGLLCENKQTLINAYKTGRGSFKVRARWEKELLKGGGYNIIISQIPYQVEKSRLIEHIADLITNRKVPLLADIRDESAEDTRIVLEPRSRNVDASMLMQILFKHSALENRFSMNLNVLDDKGRIPKLMDLRQILQAYLNHRHDVLIRYNNYQKKQIENRLEILHGYLICFLNLDEIIAIIREEENPKPVLMVRFDLTDNQAEAILNMRLRRLRKLEEMEIRKECEALEQQLAQVKALLGDHSLRLKTLDREIAAIGKQFSEETDLGKRRTTLDYAAKTIDVPADALVEKESITIVCSQKGWIRILKGHNIVSNDLKYKDGDKQGWVLRGHTTDRLLIFTSLGRFYTLMADKLPRGRGHGEPLRLLIDIPSNADFVKLLIHNPQGQLVVASSDGRGFRVTEKNVMAHTRTGRQILNPATGTTALVCRRITGDSIAVVGENRKLLIFLVEDLPVMNRGRGVILQKYKDAGLSDLTIFTQSDGLKWKSGERTRTVTDLRPWLGKRASAGRLPPMGFPRSNKFTQ